LAFQILYGRRTELDSARHRLGLMADVAALNLEDKGLSSATSWQAALAASLPKGATAEGRTVLLADGDGNIKAYAPARRRSVRQPADNSRTPTASHHFRR
jgi:hypothetical protein